jgi:hypothetical protein
VASLDSSCLGSGGAVDAGAGSSLSTTCNSATLFSTMRVAESVGLATSMVAMVEVLKDMLLGFSKHS